MDILKKDKPIENDKIDKKNVIEAYIQENMPFIYYSDVYKQNIMCYRDLVYKNITLNNNLWEKNICDLMCNYFIDNTDILDIGSNIGLNSLGFKLSLKNKKINKIHCFECENSVFNCLKFNVENHKDICIYNVGLSDSYNLVNININKKNRGCNTITNINNIKNEKLNYYFLNDNYETNTNYFVPVVPLDDYMHLFENKVSLIKIDIEGFELFMLRGSKNFLNKHKPVIIIEVIEENKYEVIDLLHSYEYKLLKHIDNENYIFIP